ncbi:hypothetical protein BDY24DRAFT_394932 [Mrakia frigida]|uniref:uncharacterized protein n=1 Tax=Mrakia frigida TaxID=29902 RepID=UPI003FCC1F28
MESEILFSKLWNRHPNTRGAVESHPPLPLPLPSLPLFCFLQMGKKHSLGALFFLPTPNHLNENMISLSSPTQHSSRGRLLLLSLSFLFVLLVLNEFNPSSPSFLLPSTTTTTTTAATFVGEQRTLSVCDSSASRMRNDSSTWRVGEKKGETEWRISEDHPWIKAKERSKVMLATSQAGNDEIFTSFLHTLAQLMPQTNIRAYAPDFLFDYKTVFDQLGIFPGGEFRDPKTFLHDVGEVNLYTGPNNWGMKADLIVLGSCEVDMPLYSKDLLRLWKARAKSEKFVLICMVHDAARLEGWLLEDGADFVKEGALRLLVASEHVKRSVVSQLDIWSDEPSTYQIGFDSLPVYTHLPILPIQLPAKLPRGEMLTHAAIAGSFHSTSRDYSSVIKDLQAELQADPTPWGYHPLSPSNPTSFSPNPTDAAVPPFVLHLVGHSNGQHQLPIPKELEHAVLVHNNLSSYHYYSAMTMMDVILPAFGGRGGYHETQASSSISLSIMCEVRCRSLSLSPCLSTLLSSSFPRLLLTFLPPPPPSPPPRRSPS